MRGRVAGEWRPPDIGCQDGVFRLCLRLSIEVE
jgi:hypothetical protein